MSNPKKDILAKMLPEDFQTLEQKTNLANRINNIFLEPQQSYELLNEKNRVDTTNAMPQPNVMPHNNRNQWRSKLDNWGGGGTYSYIRVHRL